MNGDKFLINEINNTHDIIELVSNKDVYLGKYIIGSFYNKNFPVNEILHNGEYCFYKVNKVSFDEEYPRREAFENVLLAMDNEAFNLVYILEGEIDSISLYIGVVKNANKNTPVLGTNMTTVPYAENIAEVFKGNFNGSELEELKGDKLRETIIDSVASYKYAGLITGVPSVDDENKENYDFQGIDRLINSLMGEEWRISIICEPVSKNEVIALRDNVYGLYNRLSIWAKRNVQHSKSEGQNTSVSENKSDTRGTNKGVSSSHSTNKGESHGGSSDSRNSGTSDTKSTSDGINESHTVGKSESVGTNTGVSSAITVEWANKCAQEMMKYIDEELLERIKNGLSKRMFKTTLQYMAKSPVVGNRLKVGLMSLFQGSNPSYSPLRELRLDLNNPKNSRALKSYQNIYMYCDTVLKDKLDLLGYPYEDSYVGVNTYLTPREVSLLAGIPQKEVPGISLKEAVGFGLNEKKINRADKLEIGCLVQKGRKLENMPFVLDKKSLSRHMFVAGVTGSGKTTTCQRLLSELNIPFMVIEPAKTEYRALLDNVKFKDKLVVFTLGNESLAPFRINPFELVEGELITGHIDMLKAAFTSAFPMEASMPQLLEEAMYDCYEAMGWDIETNTNDYFDNPFEPDVDAFPQLSDLLKSLEKVVESKQFDVRLKQDYIGSLKSRISHLTVGSKGMMLNCKKSTDFRYLAHHNVVLELEEIKSPEDKALIMGFILSRITAVIKNEHKKNDKYRHITLVEEAHRLLSRVEYGDSGAKKSAVETFTDLLAEVRKYGEGLIIVDQIPNKLASEVLKNTNTKIIHRILARDDKDAVGDTMLMNDKQKNYLSSLERGYAIIYTENTDNPVNVYVEMISDTNDKDIPEVRILKAFERAKENLGYCYSGHNVFSLIKSYNKLQDLILGKASELAGKWDSVIALKQEVESRIKRFEKADNANYEDILESVIRTRDIRKGYRYLEYDKNYSKYDYRVAALMDLFKSIKGESPESYLDVYKRTFKPDKEVRQIDNI